MSDFGCLRRNYIARGEAGNGKDYEDDECFRRYTRRCGGKLQTVGEATRKIMARHALPTARAHGWILYSTLHVTTTGDKMAKCLGPTVLLSHWAAATLGDSSDAFC